MPRAPTVPPQDRPRGAPSIPSLPPPSAPRAVPTAPPGDLVVFLERILPIGILALAIFGVPILVLQPEGLPRMRALEGELADVTNENEALRRSVTQLRGEVKRLREDPAAVERIARDQLGLVRKSEIVFQFPRVK